MTKETKETKPSFSITEAETGLILTASVTALMETAESNGFKLEPEQAAALLVRCAIEGCTHFTHDMATAASKLETADDLAAFCHRPPAGRRPQ